jgi:Holliday junction DNA helicase RuvB
MLDEMDNKILTTIIDKFKVGLLVCLLWLQPYQKVSETIEEVYEPFLIQEGLL